MQFVSSSCAFSTTAQTHCHMTTVRLPFNSEGLSYLFFKKFGSFNSVSKKKKLCTALQIVSSLHMQNWTQVHSLLQTLEIHLKLWLRQI